MKGDMKKKNQEGEGRMDCTFQSLPTWKFFFQLRSFNPMFLSLESHKIIKTNKTSKKSTVSRETSQKYHWGPGLHK